MTAPTLAELRTRVRQRAHLSANDSMFSDDVVSRRINMAYGDVMSAVQPNGWWWQQVEVTSQNTAGDLPQMPVVLATPDNARAIRKVGWVFASLDGNYWLPIDRRERTDQMRLAGGRTVADGLPLSWSVLPSAGTPASAIRRQLVIVFDPPLPNLAWTRFLAILDPADLDDDTDAITALPPLLAELVVEAASVALLRQRRDVGGLTNRQRVVLVTLAQNALDAWTRAARIYFNCPAAGPGYTTLRERAGA